jgi:O-antigen/teichoic acid export membrane protein
MLTVAPICALLALIGPWVVEVIMRKSLPVPISLFSLLAVWGVVSAVSNVVAMLLNGASVVKGQTIIALIAGTTNLALSILLTRRFGVIGVCLGSIIAQLAITIPSSAFLIHDLLSKLQDRLSANVNQYTEELG